MSTKSRARHLARVCQPAVDPMPALVRQQAELEAELARSKAELARSTKELLAVQAELITVRYDAVRLIIADRTLSDEAKLVGIWGLVSPGDTFDANGKRYGMDAAVAAAAHREYADYLAAGRALRKDAVEYSTRAADD